MRRRASVRILAASRRGGVLLEVMLAVSLFVGAAAFTLGCVRSVIRTLERSRLQQEAIDLARSRLAELESGLTTLAGLRGESEGAAAADNDFDETAAPDRWRIEIASSRSEFSDLTLVELTVIRNLAPEAEAAGEHAMRFTLRQLVALREDAGEAFEEDELMRGLPEGGQR